MVSVLMKLPLLSLTAKLTPDLLDKRISCQQLEIVTGKTQVLNNQVIFHLICEGTTHQDEIQDLQ